MHQKYQFRWPSPPPIEFAKWTDICQEQGSSIRIIHKSCEQGFPSQRKEMNYLNLSLTSSGNVDEEVVR